MEIKMSEKLCIGGIFVCGIVIGYVTLFVPEHSPGPIGLVYAAAYILGPLYAVWATWSHRRKATNGG